MREIKFRAWFELKNKMIYPENLALSYDGEDNFDFAFDKETKDEEGNIEGTLCFKLMQYTGLKDKNGVEIYEGDIVEYCECLDENTIEGPFVGTEVVFDDCMFCLKHDAPNPLSVYVELEVIGNIYKNPDLVQS